MSGPRIPDEAIPFQPSIAALAEPIEVEAAGTVYRAIAVAVGPVVDGDLHYGLAGATAVLCIRSDGWLTWLSILTPHGVRATADDRPDTDTGGTGR